MQASIRGSYGNRGCAAREICGDEEACGVLSTRPPAARFLLRERNRGKSAAGLRPCIPVRRALKRRGHSAAGNKRVVYASLCR